MLLMIAIMEIEWNKLEVKFEQNELGLPNQYINFLRNVIIVPNELLFLQASRTLFSLMTILGRVKNQFAPLIYKILVNAYSSFSDISKVKTLITSGRIHVIKFHREYQRHYRSSWKSISPTPLKTSLKQPRTFSNRSSISSNRIKKNWWRCFNRSGWNDDQNSL